MGILQPKSARMGLGITFGAFMVLLSMVLLTIGIHMIRHHDDSATLQTPLVFPLATNQTVVKKGSNDGVVWCWRQQQSCHHDYPAAALFAPSGTPVVAAASGKAIIVSHREPGEGFNYGDGVIIKGNDGLWYAYRYMAGGSSHIRSGNKVHAGQLLGVVGTSENAVYTSSMLSFVVAKDISHLYGSGYAGRNRFMVDPQPALVAAFKQLPK